MFNFGEIGHLSEPKIEFNFGQKLENPKDGLFLFGPPNASQLSNINIGLIGTKSTLLSADHWLERIRSYIPSPSRSAHHLPFPGFTEAFQSRFLVPSNARIEVNELELSKAIRQSLRHRAVRDAVTIFEEQIAKYISEEDENVALWLVVIPDEIFQYGRSKSVVPKSERTRSKFDLSKKTATKYLTSEPSLFEEDNKRAEVFLFEPNFHHQLKACMLKYKAVVQIVRDSTLEFADESHSENSGRRKQDDASIAWNLTTTLYYKSGRLPWSLTGIPAGVCYIGLVFKKDDSANDNTNACCGAQMFLDSGDSLVFKGAGNEVISSGRMDFHLTRKGASDLISRVVSHYQEKTGAPPTKIYVHGKTYFAREEWEGFLDAVNDKSSLVGIRIRSVSELKLYAQGKLPILRGTYLQETDKRAFLWTRGYIPRLQTYPGREVPNPLSVEIVRGEADLTDVLRDILALTKVNYNACIYADGLPVTLRFADLVGEILTAAPSDISDGAPLPFKHYI